MRIVCPACSTAYTVPDRQIGATGRKVRCARCATRWQVMPGSDDEMAAFGVDEPDTMEPMPDAPVAAKAAAKVAAGVDEDDDMAAFAAALAEDAEDKAARARPGLPEPDADDDVFADADAPVGRYAAAAPGGSQAATGADDDVDEPAHAPVQPAARPRIVAHHRPRPSLMSRLKQVVWRVRSFLFRSRMTIGVVIFLGALMLPGIAVMLRVPIVRAYPRIASLFTELGVPVNLTGLEFRKLNTLRELENGQPVLVVEGAVANLTLSSLAMPGLRLALRGADGQEIYAWSVEPKTATVPAGDEVRFRSRLAAPPEEAVDIQLRFIEPKTRHAVLP